MYSARLITLVFAIMASSLVVESAEPNKMLCALRAGLRTDDIKEYKYRNSECSLDCITKSSVVMTFFISEGKTCEDNPDYICRLGKCHPRDSEPDTSGMINADIIIHEARVDDKDPLPTTGLSDAFVSLELIDNAGPSYTNGDILCLTHVVVDNTYPRWNTTCKPSPLKLNSKLKFIVLDSDKPRAGPDFIGDVEITLQDIVNKGKQKLSLRGGTKDQNIVIEINGLPYRD